MEQNQQQYIRYGIDMVMVIDVTSSMGPVIDKVKERARSFYNSFQEAMQAENKSVDQLRVRVVAFRDFWVDNHALVTSDYFTLPNDKDRFKQFIDALEPSGGGDIPESALEALAVAMKSDWVFDTDKQRHMIVLFTDADAHPLERAVNNPPPNYPSGMPRNMGELVQMWDGQMSKMSPRGRRLVLFAPDAEPWNQMEHTWQQMIYYPSQAGEGLEEYETEEIMRLLARSV